MVQYSVLIKRIIAEQELIIGPIAWVEASKVPGLRIIDRQKNEFSVEGDGKKVLELLVTQYDRLFGHASREVCKSAILDLLPSLLKDDLPEVLQQ